MCIFIVLSWPIFDRVIIEERTEEGNDASLIRPCIGKHARVSSTICRQWLWQQFIVHRWMCTLAQATVVKLMSCNVTAGQTSTTVMLTFRHQSAQITFQIYQESMMSQVGRRWLPPWNMTKSKVSVPPTLLHLMTAWLKRCLSIKALWALNTPTTLLQTFGQLQAYEWEKDGSISKHRLTLYAHPLVPLIISHYT